MSGRRLTATRVASLRDDDVRDAVRDRIVAYRDQLAGCDAVTVLPDTHYPYHPSTGMVTNPTVVDGVVDGLRAVGIDDVAVAVTGGRHVDGRRAGAYLGYEALAAAHDVDLLVLDEADRRDVTATVDGASVPGTMPAVLRERPVIDVPTVRYGTATRVAGAVANLGRSCAVAESLAVELAVAVRALDVPVTLVDGTYTYTGTPHATGVVVDGTDVVAIDVALASLLGVDPTDEEYLRILSGGDPSEPPVDGVALADVRAGLPLTGRPRPSDPHPLVTEAYKLYTRVSGDAFPPQLLGSRR